MGLEFEDLKAIDTEYSGKNEPDAYSRLNLMNITDDGIVQTPVENYTDEIKKLYSQLALHFSKKPATDDVSKKPNKIIAVVGMTGVGKTTIVEELLKKLEQHRESLTPAKEANFVISVGGKINRFSGFFSGTGYKRGILFLDDAHMGYYPNTTKNQSDKKEIEKDYFEKFVSEFSDSLIITTWNVFGLNYALSKNPDLIKKFDKVLWVEGLSIAHLTSLIRTRVKEYSIHKEKCDFDKIFDSDGLALLIKKSYGNPRLLISLMNRAIKKAHEKKVDFISKNIFEEVISEKQIQVKPEEILSDKVLFSTLSVPRVNIKNIEAFTNLDRTTILKRVQTAVHEKILTEVSKDSKENYYSLNCFLGAEMEKAIFAQLKERLNSFVNFTEKLL